MYCGAAGLDEHEVEAHRHSRRQIAVGMQTVSVSDTCAERCVQAVISGCVYLVGDLIAQSYEGLTEGAVDKARAVRSGAGCMQITLCIACATHVLQLSWKHGNTTHRRLPFAGLCGLLAHGPLSHYCCVTVLSPSCRCVML